MAGAPKKSYALGTDDAAQKASAMKVTYTHVPRFEPGSEESVAYLRENGYALIRNVLTAEESAHAVDLLWNYLEGLGTGVARGDPATWGDDRWPINVHGGIIPANGIGQSAPQWYVRSSPRLKASFAAVWGTDDLVCSFDGMALYRPWAYDDRWRTRQAGGWFHIDQHPIGRPGLQCVQGVVNLLPMSEATGGNVLIPGSHKLHHRIPELYTERLGKIPKAIDHFRFPPDDTMLQSMPAIMCHMEPGDLLLFDSRTIHCSSPGRDARKIPQLTRAASLQCMLPRSRSPPEVIARRKDAVKRNESTTNWTDYGLRIADSFPQVAASKSGHGGAEGKQPVNPRAAPPPPSLTPFQLRLVGYTDAELRGMPKL